MLSSTNLGPMTTPVSLPPNCLEELWDLKTEGLMPGNRYTFYTQGCAVSSCCPGLMTPYRSAYEWLSSYHSPAVCPVSWRLCPGPTNLTPRKDETIAFCCPSYVMSLWTSLPRVISNTN